MITEHEQEMKWLAESGKYLSGTEGQALLNRREKNRLRQQRFQQKAKAERKERLAEIKQCGQCGWGQVPEILEVHNQEVLCPNCARVQRFLARAEKSL